MRGIDIIIVVVLIVLVLVVAAIAGIATIAATGTRPLYYGLHLTYERSVNWQLPFKDAEHVF